MSATTDKPTEQTAKVTAAAVAHATRLCDNCDRAHAKYNATLVQIARGKRYQLDEFGNKKMIERIVCEIFGREDGYLEGIETRDQLLTLVEVYSAAGIAEVERRFQAALAA